MIKGIGEETVYYPHAFRSPPNLTFTEVRYLGGRFRLIEQTEQGFTYEIQGSATINAELEWKAVGCIDRK